MARNRVNFYPDSGNGFLGASNLSVIASSVPGAFEKPRDLVQASTFVWNTGTDQYWGESVAITLDGQLMRETVDYTLAPGGGTFAVQTITTVTDWTGRWAAIMGTLL